MSDKNIPGHLYAFFANVMWGLMSPIGKSALLFFDSLSLITFRVVGACVAFWTLSLFCKKEKVAPKDMLRIFIASFFALIFNQGLFITGLSLTSPINASIVTTTPPIFTMIIAAFWLKEPITSKKVLGILLGAAGASVLILGSHSGGFGSGNMIGDLLCLGAQLSFAIYLTVFKSLSQQYSAVTINKWIFLTGTLVYLPFSYKEIGLIEWSTIPTSAIMQVLFIILGGTFLSYILLIKAQSALRPTVVSMYNYTQPIIATFTAMAMGVGMFDWQKGIAIGLIFAGVYIVTHSKSRADMLLKK